MNGAASKTRVTSINVSQPSFVDDISTLIGCKDFRNELIENGVMLNRSAIIEYLVRREADKIREIKSALVI